jgi:hypothetical protein
MLLQSNGEIRCRCGGTRFAEDGQTGGLYCAIVNGMDMSSFGDFRDGYISNEMGTINVKSWRFGVDGCTLTGSCSAALAALAAGHMQERLRWGMSNLLPKQCWSTL